MRRLIAGAGSAIFFVLAPGVVVGLLLWSLTRWAAREPWPWWAPLRLLGIVLIVAGSPGFGPAFVRFVLEGIGTRAPIAPTEHLVIGGVYGYVRNPMPAGS